MKQNETASVINHTEHSLFLTTIIMNKGLWNELTVEQQKIFADAALSAAHVERAESLEDIDRTRTRAKLDGIQVVDLDDSVKNQLQELSASVYTELDSYFKPGLVDQIRRS
jgi:TRAP-type C4-dicarboxylate transport system substrate-binding protein